MHIKKYRKWEMLGFVVGNILIFFFVNFRKLFLLEGKGEVSCFSFLINTVCFCIIAPVLVVYFESLLSRRLKEKLQFGLTGETIFSKIAENRLYDVRIDMEKAKAQYASIIDTAKSKSDMKKRRNYENHEWYKIYKKYDGNQDSVDNTQKAYLTCRDMYIASVLILAIVIIYFVVSIIINMLPKLNSIYIAIIAIQTLATLAMTRSRMKSFAYTVIAEDLSQDSKEKRGE